MAILEQRNTPDELALPNEKLNYKRTVIPVKSALLEPHVIPTSSIIRASVKKKQQNKRYHDNKAKPLPPLIVRDSIRAKTTPQSSPLWTQGSVVRRESDRSYIVKADGREYGRNRCHIRKTREITMPKVVVTDPFLDFSGGPPTQSDAALPTAPQPKSTELPGVNNEIGQMQLNISENVHSSPAKADEQMKPLKRISDDDVLKMQYECLCT